MAPRYIILLLAPLLTLVVAQSIVSQPNEETITATVLYNSLSTVVTVALIPPSESVQTSSGATSLSAIVSSAASPASSATPSPQATSLSSFTATSIPASTAAIPTGSGTVPLITSAYTSDVATTVVTYTYGNSTVTSTQVIAPYAGKGSDSMDLNLYWVFALPGLSLLLGI